MGNKSSRGGGGSALGDLGPAVARQAKFEGFAVANVHLISGVMKKANEDHSIPGKERRHRTAFKLEAMVGVVRHMHALAKPQGKVFILGDFNLLENQIAQLLPQACMASDMQKYQAICYQGADPEKRRDWIMSNGPVDFVGAPFQASDNAHFAVVGKGTTDLAEIDVGAPDVAHETVATETSSPAAGAAADDESQDAE